MFSQLFFILTILYKHGISGTNVTFIPQSIHIKVADLPEPYATPSSDKNPVIIPVPIDPILYAPDGFTVKLYMSGLRLPRYLVYTPTGDILVSEPIADRISCLVDHDGDGYPDERTTFADASNGLDFPYGMAFASGYFYVGNQRSTRRYSYIRGSRQIFGTGELIMTYEHHGHPTRTVVVSPNFDRLYIGIGSATNVDIESLPRASVQVANLDGSNLTTFAYGLRNPIGLAFHPITKDLYVTCQERDNLGDDLVPDFFTRIKENDFYGWPYAYLNSNLTDPRHRLANGTSERSDLVSITQTPDVLFQAHSSVLDALFYTGQQFPIKYRHGAFAAFHGSWNKYNATGHKLVFIPFNDTTNRPMGYYEDFVTGFLVNPSTSASFGRPVGLLVLKDGSLLFTEDGNDRIYQVQYNSKTVIANKGHRFVAVKFIMIYSLFISYFI
jgi:glucose/arabinose dehydrogenase